MTKKQKLLRERVAQLAANYYGCSVWNIRYERVRIAVDSVVDIVTNNLSFIPPELEDVVAYVRKELP